MLGYNAEQDHAASRLGSSRLREITRPFPATPSAVHDVRAWTEAQLEIFDIPNDLLYAAQLLISEVATNAIKHTRAPEIVVRLVADHSLEASVHDPDSRRLPQLSHPSLDDISGRGLALVDALATEWGTRVIDSGKWVWFRLDLPP